MGATRTRRIPTPDQSDDLETAAGAMRMLQVGRTTLWHLTNAGELPCVRIGRAVRYRRSDIAAFINARVEG